ncbi:putative tetratricopeptide repeat lipoprotein [Campylobacter iguaniorum]|uniref:Putative tetratricopeptide repeat lipoprotein n=1 Tax=Campylobacter iguaniorum TaxID=1244531 RepID=A0A076FAZ6_9BACT|nr:hypothetical protein [Campylobacter iguaniorum]AII14657.1 putative tetratricopeptide repeat lipoprotein [Campylobacter iguaniorum]
MYWCKATLVLALFLSGCSLKQNIDANKVQIYDNIDVNSTLYSDTLEAFYMLDESKNKEALNKFYELYKITKDSAYLKEALKIAFVNRDEKLEEFIKEANKSIKNDFDIYRMEIGYYIYSSQIDEAKQLAKTLLVKEGQNSINHSILGTIYLLDNKPKMALKELKIAYDLDPNEENVLKLADILDNKLDRQNDAIKYLENWIKENECSKPVCFALLNLYSSAGELNLMVELYEKLYNEFKEVKFLQRALEILVYKKDLLAAKILLEKYEFNDMALAEIYAELGEYQNAYNMATKIYNITKNPDYIAKMAIYKYEQYGKEISKFELAIVIKLFEDTMKLTNNPVYLNYYGYLLIDHEIDIKKGLELVKKAYEIDPNSPFIIDSVAWGYYKLGDCKEAKIWMDKVKDDIKFMNTNEALEHKIKIDKCLIKGKK